MIGVHARIAKVWVRLMSIGFFLKRLICQTRLLGWLRWRTIRFKRVFSEFGFAVSGAPSWRFYGIIRCRRFMRVYWFQGNQTHGESLMFFSPTVLSMGWRPIVHLFSLVHLFGSFFVLARLFWINLAFNWSFACKVCWALSCWALTHLINFRWKKCMEKQVDIKHHFTILFWELKVYFCRKQRLQWNYRENYLKSPRKNKPKPQGSN